MDGTLDSVRVRAWGWAAESHLHCLLRPASVLEHLAKDALPTAAEVEGALEPLANT